MTERSTMVKSIETLKWFVELYEAVRAYKGAYDADPEKVHPDDLERVKATQRKKLFKKFDKAPDSVKKQPSNKEDPFVDKV